MNKQQIQVNGDGFLIAQLKMEMGVNLVVVVGQVVETTVLAEEAALMSTLTVIAIAEDLVAQVDQVDLVEDDEHYLIHVVNLFFTII